MSDSFEPGAGVTKTSTGQKAVLVFATGTSHDEIASWTVRFEDGSEEVVPVTDLSVSSA